MLVVATCDGRRARSSILTRITTRTHLGGCPRTHACKHSLCGSTCSPPLAANLLTGSAARAVHPLLTSARIARTRVPGDSTPATKLMARAENHLMSVFHFVRLKPGPFSRQPFATEVRSLEIQLLEISLDTIQPVRGNETHSHQRRSRMRPAHPPLCRTDAYAFVVSFRLPTLALPCLHIEFLLLRHLTRQKHQVYSRAADTRAPIFGANGSAHATHTLFCHPSLRRALPNFLPPSVPNALGTLLTAHVCTISARVTEFPVATACDGKSLALPLCRLPCPLLPIKSLTSQIVR